MIQALLADQHGERRSIAFTEANVAASLSTTLTPLVIGGLQSAGAGWRVISALVVFFLTLLAVTFHRQSIPDSAAAQSQSVEDKDKGHLPFSFWLYWIVLFLVVAVEMSMAVWGTDFLFSVAGLSRVDAALGFSAFPAAMLIGRIAGSRLTRRWSSLFQPRTLAPGARAGVSRINTKFALLGSNLCVLPGTARDLLSKSGR